MWLVWHHSLYLSGIPVRVWDVLSPLYFQFLGLLPKSRSWPFCGLHLMSCSLKLTMGWTFLDFKGPRAFGGLFCCPFLCSNSITWFPVTDGGCSSLWFLPFFPMYPQSYAASDVGIKGWGTMERVLLTIAYWPQRRGGVLISLTTLSHLEEKWFCPGDGQASVHSWHLSYHHNLNVLQLLVLWCLLFKTQTVLLERTRSIGSNAEHGSQYSSQRSQAIKKTCSALAN